MFGEDWRAQCPAGNIQVGYEESGKITNVSFR